MSLPDPLPVPDLSDARVVGVRVGLRPCRRGGVRLETEEIGGRLIVHNYGHGGAGVTLSWGCAEVAAEMVEGGAGAPGPVGVLGAGVIGLTTAWRLAERGYDVTMYGAARPLETTSSVAGALWLPTGVEWGETDRDRARFLRALRLSWEMFSALGAEQWGVRRMPVFEIGAEMEDSRYFASGTIGAHEELDRVPLPGCDEPGRLFESFVIETPRFLGELVEGLAARGVSIVDRTLAGRDDLAGFSEPVLVNCLGLGAREVFGDRALHAVRGQVVHIEGQPIPYACQVAHSYMFPRPDVIVLGGSFDDGDKRLEEDADLTRAILGCHRRRFDLGGG